MWEDGWELAQRGVGLGDWVGGGHFVCVVWEKDGSEAATR